MRFFRYLAPLAVCATLGAAALGACSGPIDPTPPVPHFIDDPPYALDSNILFPSDAGQDAPEDAP
jgi:hypothetical protein